MSILVIAEAAGAGFRPSTFELLSHARALGEPASVILVGDDAANKEQLDGLAAKVVTVAGANLSPYSADSWVDVLAQAIQAEGADVVLFSEGQRTRDLLPRIAARLGLSAVTAGMGLTKDGGSYVVHRPAQGGKAYMDLVVEGGSALIAFRPNSFATDAAPVDGTAYEEKTIDAAANRTPVVEQVAEEGKKIDVTEAAVVICGGRGMKSEENLALLEELADILGGAWGVTRALVDAGWKGADHSIQVGKSGKTVSPGLYFACGISGATHHIMGMDTSKVVVAINTDPDALMFEYADYGITGDALQVIPEIVKEVRAVKG
ncbi:MAG: electron transfer flavoprotein subunit alpha/FixB family protein [Actinobacteria bacterium]|nr:electron transfer flavoprotein subunit alpha/FixB family protein [Actinomycetota bacterium]